ncbi:hypothetical protein [Bhargavaea cecembensis]|uniref:hypothetical protein n=1 Tax=Bhargavaea cecembensis TaxID=394098 RepID=UPI0005903BAE|nr:hypothetical protein [Bhargavaea cecembensis]
MFRQAYKRPIVCADCGREIRDGEEVTAVLTPPKMNTMVEIRAYLQKKSRVFCADCRPPAE